MKRLRKPPDKGLLMGTKLTGRWSVNCSVKIRPNDPACIFIEDCDYTLKGAQDLYEWLGRAIAHVKQEQIAHASAQKRGEIIDG